MVWYASIPIGGLSAEGGVGAGVQLLPLPLHPPCAPDPTATVVAAAAVAVAVAPLGVTCARLACGGAAIIVAEAPTGVAPMPALCVVRAHLFPSVCLSWCSSSLICTCSCL